mmetsp:Transcript_115715/g.332390  ORF Transcript_115715/g.332390 Transcript_115715/m.332390 type:complete len:268 (+) Transcript_115715:1286-2089(+)
MRHHSDEAHGRTASHAKENVELAPLKSVLRPVADPGRGRRFHAEAPQGRGGEGVAPRYPRRGTLLQLCKDVLHGLNAVGNEAEERQQRQLPHLVGRYLGHRTVEGPLDPQEQGRVHRRPQSDSDVPSILPLRLDDGADQPLDLSDRHPRALGQVVLDHVAQHREHFELLFEFAFLLAAAPILHESLRHRDQRPSVKVLGGRGCRRRGRRTGAGRRPGAGGGGLPLHDGEGAALRRPPHAGGPVDAEEVALQAQRGPASQLLDELPLA